MTDGQEVEKKSLFKRWWFWALVILVVLVVIGSIGAAFTEDKGNKEDIVGGVDVSTELASSGTTAGYTLSHGELLDANVDESTNTLVIKAKIKPSYNNQATIDQNYYNVADLIQKQGCSKFDEIQYWAVADMESGQESKVVSFTLDKQVIDGIADGNIVTNQLGDYVSNLYILPSLKK